MTESIEKKATPDNPESPREVVNKFIDCTRNPLGEEAHIFWRNEIDKLYGNQEMSQITGDDAYRGIPQIKENSKKHTNVED